MSNELRSSYSPDESAKTIEFDSMHETMDFDRYNRNHAPDMTKCNTIYNQPWSKSQRNAETAMAFVRVEWTGYTGRGYNPALQRGMTVDVVTGQNGRDYTFTAGKAVWVRADDLERIRTRYPNLLLIEKPS